nr:hypothetical protein [Tanacetum cinerariifolium]
VLIELYLKLAGILHRLALQLVADRSDAGSVKITYTSSRVKDDIDTPIIRNMVANISEFGDIKLQGRVKDGVPHLTKVENVNISTMSVYRAAPRKQAVMVIAVDEKPSQENLKKIDEILAVEDFVFLVL